MMNNTKLLVGLFVVLMSVQALEARWSSWMPSRRRDCSAIVCLNGGTCIDRTYYSYCRCDREYYGSRCQVRRRSLSPTDPPADAAQNGGQDVASGTTPPVNRTVHVPTPTPTCQTLNCQNGGQCVAGTFRAYCNCPEGYIGMECETEYVPTVRPARDGGAGSDTGTGGQGGDSGTGRRTCDTMICLNGGECISGSFHYCRCAQGYYGSRCQFEYTSHGSVSTGPPQADPVRVPTQRPEIDCETSPCQNGATCTAEETNSYCTCAEGYYGIYCENRYYTSFTNRPAPQGAQAGNNGGSGSNEDGCASAPCFNGGVCSPGSHGSYTCTCRRPYYGRHCSQRGSADTSHRSVSTGPPQAGSVHVPTQRPEIDCETSPCHNGATCTAEETYSYCTCANGYYGIYCENRYYTSFTSSPAPQRAQAGSNGGIGSAEDRETCEAIICENGGTCVDTAWGAFCTCVDGFVGRNCQYPDGCASAPCLNGGVCSPRGSDSYTCTCRRPYYGRHCSQRGSAGASTEDPL